MKMQEEENIKTRKKRKKRRRFREETILSAPGVPGSLTEVLYLARFVTCAAPNMVMVMVVVAGQSPNHSINHVSVIGKKRKK